ncbi:MAG TPA: hypothetical protein VJI67_00515, partial [archaeon]|nr:hypothetical protein [archaeon]
SLSFSVSTSSSQTKEFDLLNETGAKVEVIDAKATGDIAGSGWTVSVQDLNSSLVNDSNDNDAKIHVSVTGAVSAGTYTGTVDVNARNASTGSEEKASIEVTVVVTSAGPGCSLTVSTYSSPLCLVPATTFNAGDVVYVKAITDNCTVTDGNIALNYPDYNTRYSSTGMGVIDSTTGVCVSFSTASTDPTGTWTAQASSLSGQANLDTQGLEMIPQCSLDIAMFDSFLCTTQASSFRQDQNAYAKVVTDNCTITDGNVEFFSPANSLEQSYTGEAVDNVVGVCKRFTIDTSTPTGTWTAKAGSPAQLAGADSTTFQVTPVCTLSVGTYSDSSCLLSDTTILKPSQDPYVKVSVGPGCSPNDVNIKVKQPDGTLKTGWQNQTVTDSSAFCQQVDITQGDPSGTWLADANSAQAYGATSTFSVSSECTFTLGTYSDSLCLTPGSSFSKPSEDPYVKVSISAGCSVSDANVRVKQPDGSLDQLWTGQTVNATTSFCQKDNITGSDPTGTWTAVAESNSVDSVSVTFEMT